MAEFVHRLVIWKVHMTKETYVKFPEFDMKIQRL